MANNNPQQPHQQQQQQQQQQPQHHGTQSALHHQQQQQQQQPQQSLPQHLQHQQQLQPQQHQQQQQHHYVQSGVIGSSNSGIGAPDSSSHSGTFVAPSSASSSAGVINTNAGFHQASFHGQQQAGATSGNIRLVSATKASGTSSSATSNPTSSPHNVDPVQMNTFRSYVTSLGDPSAKDEFKLKAAQELSESLEVITQCAEYGSFLEHSMKIFLRILQDGKPHFISEYSIQQVRKQILEMIHRLPTNETLGPYVNRILSLMLKLLRTDNEENVLVCLRIIIELHKQYRPKYNEEIQHFLSYVRTIYSDLPAHMPKIFEPRPGIKDFKEGGDLEALLAETYTLTPVKTEQRSYTLVPRGMMSLKVMQELPIIVVLMYQIYKQYVHKEVADFVPLIMTTITLQPTHYNNREVFVDFIGAQIKTLSFLAYIIRLFQDQITQHSAAMVQGMLGLLQSCPKEVAHQRKELLIAARHILATDLRTKFITSMDRLFDEDLLLGRGWTVHESLRPLAYSTLADLVHHVRTHLSIEVLTKAVQLFAKNVHDESLPTSIQTMSCKLLLNLVDCIRAHGKAENTTSRDLLITMLRVFTLKFHTIAKLQLPLIMQKWRSIKADGSLPAITASATQQPTAQDAASRDILGLEVTASEQSTKLSSIGFPPPNNLNVAEYRSLVKTLVCGVKTITWGCASCKSSLAGNNMAAAKQFQPQEILIFIDLVHWALEALDIYTINVPANGQAKLAGQLPRSKEEKEVLEHFSGVFLMMNSQNFQEIFSSTIDYMVERIDKNSALQIIANSFLANPSTSPLFATVLVEYLLERMDEMGSNVKRSELYLRLFKLVFGSVSLFAAENENMLRPHLHNIVNRSMELAMTAKEPYNYFLLLRALFRSIGGGSHDQLYQEFLPLLPNLLEGLNRLQSGFHKQQMKDLFVELCLTVPVRLSSLLPYLSMLMDPLVSALNGSHTLISQGLRTLELCVDNLQPDYLYDHIQPVRADLMQALWRTLRNSDSAAQVAFRVLGKFGGGNRKMMIEPQRLEYHDRDQSPAPAVRAHFQEHAASIDFPMDRVIETAFNALKSSATDPFYWRQSWEVVRCYLAASLCLDDEKHTLHKLLMHPSYVDGPIAVNVGASPYRCNDTLARQTHQTALTAMFVAAATKDLRHIVLPTMVAVVRHYTMVAIAQQAGPFPHKMGSVTEGLDPLVLVDALATIMGHEEKELCKPGNLAMVLILDTATYIMGNKERACRLPMMQYLAEKMAALCYERPWYAKMGGCSALKFLFQHMSLRWLYQHLFVFLKAFMFVIMDLAGEVSNGAIDMARNYLEKMLRICMVSPPEREDEMVATAMSDVVRELVRQVTSSNTMVREQAMSALRLIAELQGKTVSDVMHPHREVLADIIPPKKHLLRHQPASTQIGLMDGNTFCTTLEPRLFTIDLSDMTHNLFFLEVLTLCEADDQVLNKLDCYKNVTNLVPLRTSALRALSACHYITDEVNRTKIQDILLNSLKKSPEIQQVAFECLQKFIAGHSVDKATIQTAMRPLLFTLGDYRNLTLSGVKQLSHLTQLFPSLFNEKLCEQLLQLISKMLENSIIANKGQNFLASARSGDTEQKITTMLGIFHQIPDASSKFIDSLCKLILRSERSLMIEPSCPFREPLVKFLLRYPNDTLDLLMNDFNIKDQQSNRFMIFLLKHKSGLIFRQTMYTKTTRLNHLILCNPFDGLATLQSQQVCLVSPEDRYEAQHQAVLILHTLIEYDEHFLSGQPELVAALKSVWTTDLYKSCEINVACDLWHLVAKLLLHYFTLHTDDIELLFMLLQALCKRFIPDFQFLRDFLQNTVAQGYTVDWKRAAFFYFVQNFLTGNISQELAAKIMSTIVIPCFAVGFEKNETLRLIGVGCEDDKNVISVFIGQVIDPEKPFVNDDAMRIALLQFSCLLIERASQHIHDGDSNNPKQGNKLRRLMTFAWPCLLPKICVDPAARYHGHLLLSHIIARLAIHKRIVLQVFHSLLKGHAHEARTVVRQALELLTPAVPLRMEDGYTMLTHWTKKIIVEEGHSMQQLYHILQLVVRHFRVYYPVRHHLVQHMINSIQRLGFSATATLEYRKLAVELSEVIIKWEVQRIKEYPADGSMTSSMAIAKFETKKEGDDDYGGGGGGSSSQSGSIGAMKRSAADDGGEGSGVQARKRHAMDGSMSGGSSGSGVSPSPSSSQQSTSSAFQSQNGPDMFLPIHRAHCDTVLNFLMRLACQVNEPNPTPNAVMPGENLSRRCMTLIKMGMRPDVWSQPCDLKLNYLDKVFQGLDTALPAQPNYSNIATALELLTFLLSVMKNDQILATIKPLQRGLSACVTCPNTRITRLMHALLSRLMAIFPTDSYNKHEELENLYSTVSKMIFDGLGAYEKNPHASPSSLFGTLMILKAACMNTPSYIDRLLVPYMRVLNRLHREHIQGSMGGGGAPGSNMSAPGGVGAVPGNVTQPLSISIGSDMSGQNVIHGPVALELLILSLELVKNRVIVMGVDIRKQFIGNILVGLIEKTPEVKVMRAIVKIIDEWMKVKSNPLAVNQAPSLREKSTLLVKLMQYTEKRFGQDAELNAQFLELINYIYRDEQLKQSELTAKLETAFLAGLRCNQPAIRAKFVEVFDGSMRRRLHDRLLYVICSQGWDAIGQHYWIKQCIELLILTANTTTQIQNANEGHLLPSISAVIQLADSEEKENFVIYMSQPNESPDSLSDPIEDKDDAFDMDMSVDSTISRREESERPVANRQAVLTKLIARQTEFLEGNRKIRTEQLLVATAQLCHMDTHLAERVWLDIFPRLWSILDEGQQQSLVHEIIPFLASGTHVGQKDCQPSAINTFAEALMHCQPPVQLPPNLMTYLGKAHNLWHRMTLSLEEMALQEAGKQIRHQDIGDPDIADYAGNAGAAAYLTAGASTSSAAADGAAGSSTAGGAISTNIYDPLSQMYTALHEEDMWSGLWLKYAKFSETNQAIAYEQMGYFEEAQAVYESCMQKFCTSAASPPEMISELLLWENHWIRCTKELNQWDILLDYGQSHKEKKSFLIMESAWHVPDWALMKQALLKVEHTCPKQDTYKVNIYRGFLAILNKEEQHLKSVERYVEVASVFSMREWRRLPPVVSHIHLPILQAAQQIMELQEACQIHQLLASDRSSKLHDIRAIVKTWRNRLPIVADDLSHWSDIFTWRQHHYQIVNEHLKKQQTEIGKNNSMVGAHASAQAIIHFGKIARKHRITSVCQDSLSRIYTIPSVPIVDCFQKIRQQIKCFLQMYAENGGTELVQALEITESTNLVFFSRDMAAEFLALKGQLLALNGKSDEANKAFSAATQGHDTMIKGWALWGDYHEQLFTRDRPAGSTEPRNMQLGVNAVICYLHACRHQNESKSRKYLAKLLWLLSFDDEKCQLMEMLDTYAVGVPPLHWLPWIPQLLCCLVQYEGTVVLNLLSQVSRMFPQAVYFPIRTLYLTLKIEQREKLKSAEIKLAAMAATVAATGGAAASGTSTADRAAAAAAAASPPTTSGAAQLPPQAGMRTPIHQSAAGASPSVHQSPQHHQPSQKVTIKATPTMWRVSKVMHIQREIHPTILNSLEGIVDQMVWFRENWYEEVLRQLRQGLIKCYAISFENRENVSEATITPHTLNFVKKLVSTFGIGIENINNSGGGGGGSGSSNPAATFTSSANDALTRRAQATVSDPVFQQMKVQFTGDFDFSEPDSMRLHNLIGKLKKWIKILEAKTKLLPKSFLIEKKCRFLSNFSQKTADVDLPGEQLLPRHSHYHIRIARFMPRVEIVQKHNTTARRLYIRGTNGKIYPYLVVNDSGLGDARREERVLQLMRMLNHYLSRQKETSRRFLHITVPRVVPVSPQMRMVEDNPASMSLLDVFKAGCDKQELEHDEPIKRYYERLAEVQEHGGQTNHALLRDIQREVQKTMVPKRILKDWALRNFRSATDYWQFRKMFTLQLALANTCEYALHLTRLNADMMYLHQDSGLMNISYFKFDVNDSTGELEPSRPVPFRLTPNIVEYLSPIGITGPLTASAIAIARCLVQPNFKLSTILRAILRDEIITVQKKHGTDEKPKVYDAASGEMIGEQREKLDMERIIVLVNKAATAIMQRLAAVAHFENIENNKMSALILDAQNPDSLSRMDPAWYPWL